MNNPKLTYTTSSFQSSFTQLQDSRAQLTQLQHSKMNQNTILCTCAETIPFCNNCMTKRNWNIHRCKLEIYVWRQTIVFHMSEIVFLTLFPLADSFHRELKGRQRNTKFFVSDMFFIAIKVLFLYIAGFYMNHKSCTWVS